MCTYCSLVLYYFCLLVLKIKKHNMFIDLTIWIVEPYTTVTKARIYHITRLFTVKTDGARVLDRNLNTKHVET